MKKRSPRQRAVRPTQYRLWIKRAIDIIVSAFAVVLLSPVMLVIALLIRVRMGRPVLFRQERPGLDGALFDCIKFRTMAVAKDGQGGLSSDRQRIIPLGSWLRRASLDELPQLWNILRGDVSLVGPRPLLVEYLPYYTAEEQRRHSVRPGLTGWAQIHGRNQVNFDDRLKMDVWYVDRISWKLDLQIILSTIAFVLSRKGTDLVSYPPLHEQRRVRTQVSALHSNGTETVSEETSASEVLTS